jgi:hypothetical protein
VRHVHTTWVVVLIAALAVGASLVFALLRS